MKIQYFTSLLCTSIILLASNVAVQANNIGDSIKVKTVDTIKLSNNGVLVYEKDEAGRKITIKTTDNENKKLQPIDNAINVIKSQVGATSTKKTNYELDYLSFDIGLNMLHDQSTFSNPDFVRVIDEKYRGNLFSLKNFSSRNINIWAVKYGFKYVNTDNVRMSIQTGLGLQFFSFKYQNSVNYTGGIDNHVELLDTDFTKNKLGITYLSIPLTLANSFRIGNSKKHFVADIGIIGGYKLKSWTKQKSSEFGKVKNVDNFDLSDFQLSASASIGVKGILRLYATYQLTNMWKENTGLVQHPIAIGIKIGSF